MDAAFGGVARVDGARLVVVAGVCRAGALAGRAKILGGTRIAVVAWSRRGRKAAASRRLGIADVLGARVVVGADLALAGTHATVAGVAGGAAVAIVARRRHRLEHALAVQAAVGGALVAVVADLGLGALALAVLALPADHARIVVHARPGAVVVLAAALGVAAVVCARVAIIAVLANASAHAVFAGVFAGAGVAVVAAGCERRVAASLFDRVAVVGGARVLVVARRFVGLAVAVVVDTVAGLVARISGTARAQPLAVAEALAAASAVGVAFAARRAQAELDRARTAQADVVGAFALVDQRAGRVLDLGAGVADRTRVGGVAGAAAELAGAVAFAVAVIEAQRRGAGRTALAVGVGVAGIAHPRELGYAHLHVVIAGFEGLAGGAARATGHAGMGANAGAGVVKAVPRRALAVFGASASALGACRRQIGTDALILGRADVGAAKVQRLHHIGGLRVGASHRIVLDLQIKAAAAVEQRSRSVVVGVAGGGIVTGWGNSQREANGGRPRMAQQIVLHDECSESGSHGRARKGAGVYGLLCLDSTDFHSLHRPQCRRVPRFFWLRAPGAVARLKAAGSCPVVGVRGQLAAGHPWQMGSSCSGARRGKRVWGLPDSGRCDTRQSGGCARLVAGAPGRPRGGAPLCGGDWRQGRPKPRPG